MSSMLDRGMVLRQFLLYGQPWQRACFVLILIAAGAAMIALGILAGIFPALLGIVIGVRIWGPTRLRAARFRRVGTRHSRDLG
jgi:hypothetical protein